MSIKKAKIGFGTYKILDQEKMNVAIKCAIESGYDFIDTAKLYNTEILIANALKKYKEENPNKKLPLLQSKVWPTDFKNGIKKEMLASFERLGGIKKIDSFLLHRPHVDNSVNVQAWKELIQCKKENLVDEIGLSNFEPDMIRILYNETNVMPDFIHIEASVTYIRKDRIKHANVHNLPMQGWRPFGNPQVNFNSDLLKNMANKYNCTIAQIMIAFSKYFGFAPVPRSDIEKEIKENIEGLKINLSKEDAELIEKEMNTHESTTHNKCDSYANLSLDEDWYKYN